MRVRWNRGSPRAAAFPLVDHAIDNLSDCGNHLAQEIRNLISVQGPPRSPPGQPPHMDTQRLIASYDFGLATGIGSDRWSVTVGSDEVHAPYLEQGTWKMAPRPHLVNTLLANMNPMAVIMSR